MVDSTQLCVSQETFYRELQNYIFVDRDNLQTYEGLQIIAYMNTRPTYTRGLITYIIIFLILGSCKKRTHNFFKSVANLWVLWFCRCTWAAVISYQLIRLVCRLYHKENLVLDYIALPFRSIEVSKNATRTIRCVLSILIKFAPDSLDPIILRRFDWSRPLPCIDVILSSVYLSRGWI